MKNKEAVLKINEILGLKDKFNRIDIEAKTLLELDGAGLLKNFYNDCQNNSISVKDFIEYAKKDHRLVFECYIVESHRSDVRFSIEGFWGKNLEHDLILEIERDCSESADEFESTESSFRAWWD